MITIDSDPEANPIFIGGLIISFFNSSDSKIKKISILFEEVKIVIKISFDIFLQALDWLFIIGVVDLNDTGDLVYAPK
ncbi:Uncharacterised protein [Yersinia enterocolitica]|uniref:Uncharacterized protein n=1 Tax=Yersinia enterocolitica TaxID=630 RepID=A0A9P1PSG9_YEREN|nr:ABC-three component system middle component 6 [Yersinia enterocolitica]CNE88049.1 Uncharacterised protein [Yersinia enterocolitica]